MGKTTLLGKAAAYYGRIADHSAVTFGDWQAQGIEQLAGEQAP